LHKAPEKLHAPQILTKTQKNLSKTKLAGNHEFTFSHFRKEADFTENRELDF